MSARLRIAADIGNSSIKLGHESQSVTSNDPFRITRVSLESDTWLECIEDFLDAEHLRGERLDWMIASVNSPATDHLKSWLSSRRVGDSWRYVQHSDVGIQIDVKFPERVGIDRLLAARGAHGRANSRSAIVIDAGTAITIDLLDQTGCFHGGAIMPGIGLQFHSLHQETDRLPRLPIERFAEDDAYPGKNTESAIASGVVNSVVGAIERVVTSVASSTASPTIFLTGGDAGLISTKLSFSHEVIEELPLRTLYAFDSDE